MKQDQPLPEGELKIKVYQMSCTSCRAIEMSTGISRANGIRILVGACAKCGANTFLIGENALVSFMDKQWERIDAGDLALEN